MPTRRRVLAASASVLFLPFVDGPAATASAGPLAASVAVDWQRTAARTAYVERGNPPPLGALYLAFTSLAVHDAAMTAQKQGTQAAAAAVAAAAPDRHAPAVARLRRPRRRRATGCRRRP